MSGVVAPGDERFAQRGIAKKREVNFVELHVPASGSRQRHDFVAVHRREVGEEFVHIGIDCRIDRIPPAAVMRETRRWHRHLCRQVGRAGEKPVTVDRNIVRMAQRGDGFEHRRGVVVVAVIVLEDVVEGDFPLLQPVDFFKEIEVEKKTPEFAIGRHLQPDIALARGDMRDAFILNPPQGRGGYLSGCLRPARIEKRLRP